MADYNVLFGGDKTSGVQRYAAGVQSGQAKQMNELAIQERTQAQDREGITRANLADKTQSEKTAVSIKMLRDKLDIARNQLPAVTPQNYAAYAQWATEALRLPQEFYADPKEVANLSPDEFNKLKTGMAQTADQFIAGQESAAKMKREGAAKKEGREYERETKMSLKREGTRSAKELKTMDIEQKQREQLMSTIDAGKKAEADRLEKDELDVDIVKDLFGINDMSALDPETSQNILDVMDLSEDYMGDDLSKVKAKKRAYEEVMGAKATKKKLQSDITGSWTRSSTSVGRIKGLVNENVPVSEIYKKLRKEGVSDAEARKLLGEAGFR